MSVCFRFCLQCDSLNHDKAIGGIVHARLESVCDVGGTNKALITGPRGERGESVFHMGM